MEKLSKTLIYGGAGLCVPALLLIVVLFVDYHSAPTKQIDGKVIGHKLTPGMQIPVSEGSDCWQQDQFKDCSYKPEESESVYALVVSWQHWADVMGVPRSYFYSTKRYDRIPIRIKEGLITGWTYDIEIKFPTKDSL